MLSAKKKLLLRAKLREAIRAANMSWSFSCHSCKHCYSDKQGKTVVCGQGVTVIPSMTLLPAHMLPTCFYLDHMHSPYGGLLTWMNENNIDFFNAERGWPTIVTRLLTKSANNVGHVMNVRRDNLEKFSW